MQFEPIGGFPPIIRKKDEAMAKKTFESRGFAVSSSIVDISNIMDTKKKENLFIAFGQDEESRITSTIENMLDRTPHQYDEVIYLDVQNIKPKKRNSKTNSKSTKKSKSKSNSKSTKSKSKKKSKSKSSKSTKTNSKSSKRTKSKSK